jgi:putative intracellular protease/amidase
MNSILMIVTSHDRLGSSDRKTGFWFEELAAPYLELTRADVRVDIASPLGGRPPVDPKSEAEPSEAVSAFLADSTASAKLEQTLPLASVQETYAGYFVVGGHGVMWDLPKDPHAVALLAAAYEAGKVIAAVCHGPAALVHIRLPSSGKLLLQAHRATGFTNSEERGAGLASVVPFALETSLRQRSRKYENGPDWQPFAVRDGQLVTGQNPASSVLVAREMLAALG